MSRPLTIELSDETYTALERRAQAAAQSPAEVAVAALELRFGNGNGAHRSADDAAAQEARLRFERRIGAIDLGYPTGADNESIDADLAREYGNNHEDK